MNEYQLDRMLWIRDKARIFGVLSIREIADHFGITFEQARKDIAQLVEYDRSFIFNTATGEIKPCRTQLPFS